MVGMGVAGDPAIAIGKVFLKFLRELYQGSYFYHAGDHDTEDAPSENIEERIAEAADNVLAEQESKSEDKNKEKDKEKEAESTLLDGKPPVTEKPV